MGLIATSSSCRPQNLKWCAWESSTYWTGHGWRLHRQLEHASLLWQIDYSIQWPSWPPCDEQISPQRPCTHGSSRDPGTLSGDVNSCMLEALHQHFSAVSAFSLALTNEIAAATRSQQQWLSWALISEPKQAVTVVRWVQRAVSAKSDWVTVKVSECRCRLGRLNHLSPLRGWQSHHRGSRTSPSKGSTWSWPVSLFVDAVCTWSKWFFANIFLRL